MIRCTLPHSQAIHHGPLFPQRADFAPTGAFAMMRWGNGLPQIGSIHASGIGTGTLSSGRSIASTDAQAEPCTTAATTRTSPPTRVNPRRWAPLSTRSDPPTSTTPANRAPDCSVRFPGTSKTPWPNPPFTTRSPDAAMMGRYPEQEPVPDGCPQFMGSLVRHPAAPVRGPGVTTPETRTVACARSADGSSRPNCNAGVESDAVGGSRRAGTTESAPAIAETQTPLQPGGATWVESPRIAPPGPTPTRPPTLTTAPAAPNRATALRDHSPYPTIWVAPPVVACPTALSTYNSRPTRLTDARARTPGHGVNAPRSRTPPSARRAEPVRGSAWYRQIAASAAVRA